MKSKKFDGRKFLKEYFLFNDKDMEALEKEMSKNVYADLNNFINAIEELYRRLKCKK